MPPPQQLTQLSAEEQHLLYPEAGTAKPQDFPMKQRAHLCQHPSRFRTNAAATTADRLPPDSASLHF